MLESNRSSWTCPGTGANTSPIIDLYAGYYCLVVRLMCFVLGCLFNSICKRILFGDFFFFWLIENIWMIEKKRRMFVPYIIHRWSKRLLQFGLMWIPYLNLFKKLINFFIHYFHLRRQTFEYFKSVFLVWDNFLKTIAQIKTSYRCWNSITATIST